MQMIDQSAWDKFHDRIKDEKVTVSSVTMGKQTIHPASQIPMVDRIWKECTGLDGPCFLFDHCTGDSLDVCRVDAIPAGFKTGHLIVAAPNYKGEVEAQFMLEQLYWNGCNYQETKFTGDVHEAMAMYAEHVGRYNEKAQDKLRIQPDWLCVTVDYHS